MLTDKPSTPVHIYDPEHDPTEAAELRKTFEHVDSDMGTESSVTPSTSGATTPPPTESESEGSEQGFAPPSPPPPRHRRAAAHVPGRQRGQSSSVNISFAPNVAVHMDSGIH